ncbi:unnamed protein product [Spirodela intermedia]|uniref:Uncharacterized protein n=1 Tax=Spirodela intermedia TaxID=51605 RepID=A0A7I8LB83_SPIIN|nr:unnamed protein product [Spirodela intermedia]
MDINKWCVISTPCHPQ